MGRTGTTPMSFAMRLSTPVVIVWLVLMLLVLGLGGRDAQDTSTLGLRIASGLVLSVVALVVVRWARTRAPRPPTRTPQARVAVRSAMSGLLLWLVPAALAIPLMAGPVTLRIPATEVALTVLLVAGAVLLSEAIPEEIVFRGHAMDVLGERLGPVLTITAQALLFTAFALLLRGWTGLLDLSLFLGMGIGLGYLRLASGSVWTAVGFHTGFQTGSQIALSHDVVALGGSDGTAMVALGTVPFAVGAVLVAVLVSRWPDVFTGRATRRGPDGPHGTPAPSDVGPSRSSPGPEADA